MKIDGLMRRRAMFAVLSLGLPLVAAVVPWTLASDAMRSAVSDQLRELYGLELSVNGRSTIALLPIPRLKFENVTLAASDGRPVVRGGTLRGELRVLPLLLARLDLAEVSLRDAAIEVDIDRDGRTAWDAAIAASRERLATNDARSHVRRIVLKAADLQVRDRRTGFEAVLRGINLAADWPKAESPVHVAASATWRGEPIELTAGLQPSALAAGRPSRIDMRASAPPGRLAVSGDASWSDAPRLVGRASLDTRSLRDLSRWSGLDVPLGHLIEAFALDGEIDVNGRDISWPSARLTLAGDRLSGALSARLEGGRRTITGTLAADRLDLTGFAAPLLHARTPTGGWSSEAIHLDGQNGTDLDLRLSASSARIGPLRLEDLAANISIKPGRYEASISGASINKGAVKGRAVLTSAADGIEVRAQGSFERLDVASLLTDLGSARWIGGSAQGQFAFEGSGDSSAEIVRRLHGRAGVTVRQGELVGIGLHDALRRKNGRPPALSGRGERTPFDEARLNITIMGGTAEITDGGLTAAGLRAALRGSASLSDRMLAARADVEGTGLPSAMVVDISGPWNEPSIVSRAPTQEPETTGSGRLGSSGSVQ
jgi:AsmA protein